MKKCSLSKAQEKDQMKLSASTNPQTNDGLVTVIGEGRGEEKGSSVHYVVSSGRGMVRSRESDNKDRTISW